MKIFLYNCLILILLPAMAVRIVFKSFKDKDYRLNFLQRFGIYNNIRTLENPIWFHAVSLGEVISSKKIISKILPRLFFEGRFQYLNKGKIKNKLFKNENILIDGAHSTADAKNLATYLKNIKIPKYGIWAMTRNKEPEEFIES